MRILCCGSRYYTNIEHVRAALLEAIGDPAPEEIIVVTGGAGGADMLAAQVGRALGATIETFPADWSRGRSAGPTRNARMVAAGADLCLAFGQGRGTDDTVRRATNAGIPVRRVDAS